MAQTAPSITVVSALGPVSFPSQGTWSDNALKALTSSPASTSFGSPGTPEYYHSQGNLTLPIASIISAQNFGLWEGMLSPENVYGPAFSGEHGNAIYFPVFINGNGTQFSLSQLTVNSGFAGLGIPPPELQVSVFTGAYSGMNIGILFGADHSLGGGDDVYVTSGSNTQLVDAYFNSGLSVTFMVPGGLAGDVSGDQNLVDSMTSRVSGTTSITATYNLTGSWGTVTGIGRQNFGTAVPEPATYVIIFGLIVFLLGLHRKVRTDAT